MLTVKVSIPPMRCTAAIASGTVLWSVLLPVSRETQVTRRTLGQGGGVRLRHRLAVCHDGRGFSVGAHR